MTLNAEAHARATEAEAVEPEGLDEAVTPPPAPVAPRRRFGVRVLLLLAVAGLAAAGWFERAPILLALGLAPPAPSTPAAETDKSDAAPADPDRVTLDAAGQTRIGLAFGTAETRRIVLPLRVPGTVSFDERRVTHLKPRTPGRVLSLAVQPGDRVQAGETLATLDAASLLDARNGYLAAQASLGEAQASEAVAALQLKRGQEQLKFGGVAQAEVERRQVDLAKAQAAVKSAQANAEMYRAQYQRLAPTEGGGPPEPAPS